MFSSLPITHICSTSTASGKASSPEPNFMFSRLPITCIHLQLQGFLSGHLVSCLRLCASSRTLATWNSFLAYTHGSSSDRHIESEGIPCNYSNAAKSNLFSFYNFPDDHFNFSLLYSNSTPSEFTSLSFHPLCRSLIEMISVRGDFWALSVEILVFPRSTGYTFASLGFLCSCIAGDVTDFSLRLSDLMYCSLLLLYS